ncbi:Initiation-specific alpha-1 [Lachnellula suecica]|uniref:Initiation-specific alpha-1 n=1 Tax=Lachnellula suecica TaxID=602035 RepID=A0A8T9C4L4_9HELO|nr:Initiation-specific alpha-1 [Lachnellula suecica]
MSQFVGQLPTRVIRRALPAYVGCIFLFLFLWNLDSFGSGSSEVGGVLKRDVTQPLRAKPQDQFPRKIWQTWKVDPLDFEERDLSCARTWTQKNPGHRYEVLTDSNDMYYVETHFGPQGLNRPDIVYMYRSLTLKIIKADLLRYLVMYVEGGLYADIDVEALRPLDRFIPDRYNERDVQMVIGVEIDQPDFKNHPILGKKSESFCQWTFMAKPGLPVMMKLIDGIVKWLNGVSKAQKVPVSEIVLDFDEVISGTGPSAFTGALLADMSRREGKTVTWKDFHNLGESKLVGGVLVLTVEAFAAGQGHSDSGNHNARTALVKHRYHASQWPNQHHRYKHPVFGEVEKCNWDPECVSMWDYSKAAFEQLPAEEQAQQIAEKEAADKIEFEKEEALKRMDNLKKLTVEEQANLEKLGQWEREQARKKAEAEGKPLEGDAKPKEGEDGAKGAQTESKEGKDAEKPLDSPTTDAANDAQKPLSLSEPETENVKADEKPAENPLDLLGTVDRAAAEDPLEVLPEPNTEENTPP